MKRLRAAAVLAATAALSLIAAALPARAQNNAFAASGATVSLAATGSSAVVQVQPATLALSPNMRVYNSGSVAVFLVCGNASTVATAAAGLPVAPGTVEVIGCPQTHIAGITAGTAVTVYLTPGNGL